VLTFNRYISAPRLVGVCSFEKNMYKDAKVQNLRGVNEALWKIMIGEEETEVGSNLPSPFLPVFLPFHSLSKPKPKPSKLCRKTDT
jgi:hypothetical protein